MLLGEMLPLLAGAALLGTALLTGSLIALPAGRPREVGVSLVFGLSVAAWLQSYGPRLAVWCPERNTNRLGNSPDPRGN